MSEIKKAPFYLDDPHLSVGTKKFLKVVNAGKPVESLPVDQARQGFVESQNATQVDLSGITEEFKTINQDGKEVKIVIVRPEGVKENSPAFMFLHGGGWVLGDYQTHKRLVRDVVVESGYPAVFVEYTRAPEAKFPEPLNQCYAATKWVAQNGKEIGIDGSRIAVVGNSAGGNMTIGVCMMAKENGGPDIKCQVLMWPYSDASTDSDSYKLYGENRFLTTPLMVWMRDNYLNDKSEYENVYVSPDRATKEQLQGLPPTLIEVAENDILRDGGEKLGRHLDEAGVFVTTIRFNGVTHDWGLLNGYAELSPVKSLAMFSGAMLKKYLG